ncbi:MAG TPA: MFS transporter [Bryobacteraceae bacterium]|nr:MFS transporter [Bryobacteraceae bacterium]
MALAMAVAVLAVFAFGMVTVFPGSIKLRLVERTKMDDAQMGKSITVWQASTLVLTILIGPLLDQLGHKLIVIVGFLLVGIAMCLFAIARRPRGVFFASVLLGAGGSCINTAGNTLLPALNTANPAAASNLGNVFFGLGAFIVPFVISFLFARIQYTLAVALFGFLSFAAVVPALFATYPAVSATYDWASALSLLHNPTALIAGVILFCYIGLEVSSASWTTTYLTDIGLSESRASLIFSLFWVAMIIGRLVASRTVTTSVGKTTIEGVALAAGLGLLVLTLTKSKAVASLVVIVTGLFYAPIFPTTVGVTFSKFPPSLYGSVFAIMFAIGLLGPSTIPALIGYYSKTKSIRVGYRLMVMLAVLLAIFALFL